MIIRNQSYITYAIWLILIGASVAAFVLGDLMIGFVGLATLAMSFAPALMAERFHLQIPVRFYAGLVMFLFGTIFLGEAFDFYERFWWWDIALHGSSAVGFGIVGVVLTLLMFEGDRYAAPPYAVAGIAFSFAVTIGVVWEVFEYTMDQLLDMNMQKSGLEDTMSDLIVDCFGAFIGAMTGYAYLKGRMRTGLPGILAEFVLRNRRFFRRASRDLVFEAQKDVSGKVAEIQTKIAHLEAELAQHIKGERRD